MNKNFTDMHCHMIFGVDDGSGDLDMSMKMLDMSYEEGVRTIIFTPHFAYGQGKETADLIKEHYEIFRAEALKKYPDMKFYLGNEIFYSDGVIELLREGIALPMAGTRYVLIEFSPSDEYDIVYKGTRKIIDAGYVPVIAHIERYSCLTKRQERIDELIHLGAYLQVNVQSFIGGMFNKTASWVNRLLSDGCVHFVADDCHNTDSRKPVMKSIYEKMLKKHSEETLDRVFISNVEKLLSDKYI